MTAEDQRERRGLLPRFTLKDDYCFLLADAVGDIQGSEDGLYRDDTRMLSRYELEIAGRRPSLLGASIDQQNTLFTAHLTNRPLPAVGDQTLPRGVIHVERRRFLFGGRLYEELRFENYGRESANLPLRFTFAADFADIFEVQGQVRRARGELLAPCLLAQGVRLAYRGLDAVLRNTQITFSLAPQTLDAEAAEFLVRVARGERRDLLVEIDTRRNPEDGLPSAPRFRAAEQDLGTSMGKRLGEGASLSTSGRLFNLWIDKSRSDLALLTTQLPAGPYPFAGIPWFATQFGRDALITGLQTLWLDPALSTGVLRFLAETQATEEDPSRDAEPGKILHEARRGEMATLREVPFGRYYGSVDATPLFVMLAGAYEERTGDRTLADAIWPHLTAAVGWIERRLQASPTGFLDYQGSAADGLVNQGWKDSRDSIFDADGSFPQGPVATVEVQGYVYAAFQAMAQLLGRREDASAARRFRTRARALRAAIEEKFWVAELGCYGIAIGGDGRVCRVRASNAGHLLYCKVPSAARARRITELLLSEEFSSGWGIRTLSSTQARYNPMSYHNGSVWPHDTALCAAGMAAYGQRAQAVRILSDVFEAAHHFGMRLPELYCGFTRVEGQSPIPYPVACLPQAWAAGAIFMLLQACLGVSIDGSRKEVHVSHPQLPVGIESVVLNNLLVGDATLHLEFRRLADQIVVAPREMCGSGAQILVHMDAG